MDPALTALAGLVPSGGAAGIAGDDGWLSVRIDAERAADVNRTLARAGIFASRLETGNDLESLFLELTRGAETASREGTFFGLAGADAAPPAASDRSGGAAGGGTA